MATAAVEPTTAAMRRGSRVPAAKSSTSGSPAVKCCAAAMIARAAAICGRVTSRGIPAAIP